MEKLNTVVKTSDIRNKINEIVDNFIVTKEISGSLSQLQNLENGYYKWSGTLSGISGTWVITKKIVLFSATNIEDPRVMLNSSDLTNWYSPYATWHA